MLIDSSFSLRVKICKKTRSVLINSKNFPLCSFGRGELFYLVRTSGGDYIIKGNPDVSFRKTEILIMQKLCEGKKTKQIAAEMNLSPKTVENYRKVLLAKTGSKNVAGIIRYALLNGIVW